MSIFKRNLIIYLCINILFILPAFLVENNLFKGSMYPPLNYLYGMLIYYGLLFAPFIHILLFIILIIIDIRFSVIEKKAYKLYYSIFFFLLLIDIYLNIVCWNHSMMIIKQ